MNSKGLVEPYFEVVFWKMFSQGNWRDARTDSIVDYVLQNGVTAADLRRATDSLIETPTENSLSQLR
jgi:hypothetical protein